MFRSLILLSVLSVALTGCFNLKFKSSHAPVMSHDHKKHKHYKAEAQEEEKSTGYGFELFKRS